MKLIKTLILILPIMSLLTMIFGCGETGSKPKEWKNAKSLAENLDHPAALKTDGKFVYFITGGTVAGKNEGTNNVMKMPVEGGTPTIIFKGGEIIPDAGAIALDENYVYFSANGLRRVPKTGGDAQLLTDAFIAWEIAVDNQNVYWMPYVGEGMKPAPIYTVSKNGGAAKTLTDARPSANGLCVDDKFVYWIQTDGIYKVGKRGGNVEQIYKMSAGNEIVSDLKSDTDNFYFLQVQSKKLMKLAKSGGAPQQIAKNVEQFWVGDNEIIYQSRINFNDTAIMKVGKNGENETQLDSGGYLSDLAIGRDKIYLSDIVKILELKK